MPHNKIHEELSKKRTGKSFADLHDWMCGEGLAREEIAKRHSVTKVIDNLPYVRERWGDLGVQEYLYHIQDDFDRNLAVRLSKFMIRLPILGLSLRIVAYMYHRLVPGLLSK